MSDLDLSGFDLIVRDDFQAFNHYNGQTGLWSTKSARDTYVTNGPKSVFLDGTEVDSKGNPIGLDPITSPGDGTLSIGAGIIPKDRLTGVRDLLASAGQSEYAQGMKYYTGRISTGDTWGQEYGYFEITAKIPEGKGHWPAFWMEPAGEGWPPEIDIFEAYGRGVHGVTGADNQFNTAVFFDAYDTKGNKTQSTDIENPYYLDALGNPEIPDAKFLNNHDLSAFHHRVDAEADHDIDIYDGFATYGCKWTPKEITFYFGKDHDHMVEVYRTPTPDDLSSPMVLIANDQITSNWGWNPVAGYDAQTFAADNTLQIDQISIYAMHPDRTLRGTGIGAVIVDGDTDSTIVGTKGADQIAPGDGLDFIDLRGGADVVYITRGVEGDVITGFGRDDVAVIEGFNIEDGAEALARLTQVGDDVWLSNGSYPKDPQSVIFRDAKVGDFEANDFMVRWSATPDIWSSNSKSGARLEDADSDGIVRADPTGSIMTDAGATKFKGAMTLDGSDVGDKYYVYKGATQIVENAHGGIDTVYATKTYTLGANVENITAYGSGNGNVLTGNALGNVLTGNLADNILVGGAGDDFYDLTNGGADTVRRGMADGHDVITGFGADDTLVLDGVLFPSAAAFALAVSKGAAGIVIDLGAGQSVTLRDADLGTVLAHTQYATGGGGLPTSRVGFPGNPYALPLASGPGVAEGAKANPMDPTFAFDNEVTGSDGNEQLKGTSKADRIFGLGGNDVVNGGVGTDKLLGGDGDDNLTGANDDDGLIGGNGNDRLTGGRGSDFLEGGAGNDRFIFGATEDGRDIVSDYTDGEDVISLTGGVHIRSIAKLGADTLVELDQGGEIVFSHMTAAAVKDTVDFLYA